jgi:plasmid stabilization system protein ParE
MPYRLSILAERDLEEIWSYVAEDASPTTADRLIDAMFDRFELLAEQPRIGRTGRILSSAAASACVRVLCRPVLTDGGANLVEGYSNSSCMTLCKSRRVYAAVACAQQERNVVRVGGFNPSAVPASSRSRCSLRRGAPIGVRT